MRIPPGRSTRVTFASLGAVVRRQGLGRKVIGFDVFDTLLRRRIVPEAVKDLVARRLAAALSTADRPVDWTLVRHKRRLLEVELGQANESRGHDHEFNLPALMELWVAQCNDGRLCKTLATDLLRHEEDLERRATFPTPGIAAVLASLAERGQRLIYISDTYLDARAIQGLLAAHGLARFFQAGYCSSTYLRTKRSGALYREVLKAEGLQPADLLFIGDNPYSDVDSPTQQGIEAIQIRDPRELRRRTHLQMLDQLAPRRRFWSGRLARAIIETGPTHLKPSRSVHYELGTMLAPAFIGFTHYIIEQARALGLERLLFLSREGLTFLRLYRRIVRVLGLDAPPAVYLGVSRASTFLPSMQRLDMPELERMWRQYDRQSMERLLRNLSLPAGEFLPLAVRCGFTDCAASIEDPRTHEPFTRFLADPEVQTRFTTHRDRARELLHGYMRAKGGFSVSSVGLVDIGWKGSIQDNLVHSLTGITDAPRVHGLYFGLVLPFGNDDVRSPKSAYLTDSRRGNWIEQVILHNGPVFEMFSSAPHGTVTGYRELPNRPGQVKPVVRTTEIERRNLRSYAVEVFQGIEDYFRQYLEVAPLIAAGAEDFKPAILDQLRRYILYPTGREARAFVRYSHVESFGVHHVSTYEFKGSWREILFKGSPLGIPRRLITTLERQFWPEAALKRSRVPLANLIYDLLETRFAGR